MLFNSPLFFIFFVIFIFFYGFVFLRKTPSLLASAIKWVITFYLVLIGWVFFRAQSIASAFNILGDMHRISGLPAPATGRNIKNWSRDSSP